MKNFFGWVFLSGVLLASCTKSTDTSSAESGNWLKRSDFEGVTRAEAVSFVVNGKAFIGTGYNGIKQLKDFWQYDDTLNQWTQKADFGGVARSSAVAFAIDDMGYVGTGYNGLNSLKDFWEYNSITNNWTQKNDFAGTARYNAVAFSINSSGYISTGFDGNYLKDLWQYSPSTDSWTQQVSMGGSKRSEAVAFVYNSKAYITTGSNNGTVLDDLWEYDPALAVWTEKRKIANVSEDSYDDDYSIVRSNAAAFVSGDKAYITTGQNSAYLATTWVYDFATDIWTAKSDFEGTARDGALGFSINNKGFIVTGKSSTSYFDDIFEFKPNETLNTYD